MRKTLLLTLLILSISPRVDSAPDSSCFDGLCEILGTTFMKAVDDRRVLVAIDVATPDSPEDFIVDHFFMYVASEPIQLPSLPSIFRARVFFTVGGDNSMIQIQPIDTSIVIQMAGLGDELAAVYVDDATHRYDRSMALGHNDGARDAPRIDEMASLKLAESCDHTPGSCWVVNGYPINFPI